MTSATRAALGLGANVGDSRDVLRAAVTEIVTASGIRGRGLSRLYRTAPVGGPEQPDYLNAVLVLDAEGSADQLLDLAHAVENRHGRTRTVRWGPRTLDVDVLAHGTEVTADPRLTLPHPRAHERAFVLLPWADVDPDFVVPGHGRVRDLAAAMVVPDGDVVPLPDPDWERLRREVARGSAR